MVLESLLTVGVSACSGWGGYALARHRFRAPTHEHAYGLWEDCHISRGTDLIPGQKRDCLGCGERQVRTVTTQEAV